MSLHDKLKEARIKKGLKQSDVASQIGCASTSFTNWESGKVNPPLEQLQKICGIYGISPLDLLDHVPTFNEVYDALQKPVAERTYIEQVAIAFSGEIDGWVGGSESSPDEEELVRLFRRLDKPEQKVVLRMLRGL